MSKKDTFRSVSFSGDVYIPEEAPPAYNDWFKANRSAEFALSDWGPTLTRQEFAEEADINFLMARYERTGIPPAIAGMEPQYLDTTGFPDDLQVAMNQIIQAENAFMQLPAAVRKEFDNDPVQFVQFAADPENLPQMRTWGLAPPEAVPEPPQRVEIVNPPPAQDDPKGSS